MSEDVSWQYKSNYLECIATLEQRSAEASTHEELRAVVREAIAVIEAQAEDCRILSDELVGCIQTMKTMMSQMSQITERFFHSSRGNDELELG